MKNLRQAVILAGGLGERLRPLTLDVPKPLVPVQGKPILLHIFDILKRNSINEVYLSIGYLSEKIISYFDGKDFGIKINYIIEKERAGTGGWMFLTDPDVFDEDFVVLNGDNLLDIDFHEVYSLHNSLNAAATIVGRPIPIKSFGGAEVLDISESGKAVDYIDRESASGFLEFKDEAVVSSGYYIFNRRIFDLLPQKLPMSNEKDLFPFLAKNGSLAAYISRALWFDTGTFERLEEVEAKWFPSYQK